MIKLIPARNREAPELRFVGFLLILRGDDFRILHATRAEEETQMPRAALTAAKRPQEQRKQEDPLQDAFSMGTQNVFATAKRASPRANPKRNCLCSGHQSI
jgi:hypothetical protein